MKGRTQSPADALFARAATAYQANRLPEAQAQLEQAIGVDGGHYHALYLLGMIAFRERHYERSIDTFRRAIRSDRKVPEGYTALGAALLALGELDEAASCFRRALALRPADSMAHSNLGEALRRLGSAAESEVSLRRAIALDASNAEARFNLGGLLAETGREAEAAACLARAVELAPQRAEIHANLGAALQVLGRFDEAIDCYRRALALDPSGATFRLSLAHTLLMRGDLEEGWREYDEWRFGPARSVPQRDFPQPHWRGEPLEEGAVLLVWMEQGIADEMMLASLLPDIRARAPSCVLECAPKLVPLFRRSFPGIEVVARSDPPDAKAMAAQWQVAAGSAARWLRPTVESFPAHACYLHPDPARVDAWRRRLAAIGPGLKVGFAWRSKDLWGTRWLSCAAIEEWEPILRTPGASFVVLQYDECAAEVKRARARFGIEVHAFPEVDLFDDLEEAAALTQAMDLVITAPTAASTLAAALGVETWQIAYGPDWKKLGTGQTPWHPTLSRFDRASGQPWSKLIQNVADKLAARTASSGRP